jgi:transcriptional regulator with XRE-family HTH domain
MPRLPVAPPRKLFALLRHLGIDQQGLAEHLGVSHTLISLWAHGKKPIPEKHRGAIDTLMHETFTTLYQDLQLKVEVAEFVYHASAREAREEETEAMRTAMATWKTRLQACTAALDTYSSMQQEVFTEMLLLSGDLHRVLYEACRTVGYYGAKQPHHLETDEREEMRRACLVIQESLRRLGQLESTSPALDAQFAEQRRVLEQKLREVG